MAEKASESLPVQDPTDTERRLWSAFPCGEVVDLRAGDPDADDPRAAASWEAARRVRAEVVAALMLGAVAPAAAHVPRLRLAGALIEGTVDVSGGIVACAVEMMDCNFTGDLLFAEAQVRTILLFRSILEKLDGSAAEVRGSLILRECRAKAVDLGLARISGQLNLSGAKLTNPGGAALDADGMTVEGGIFCTEEFQAEGEVWLSGAHIGGQLNLSGAKLTNPGGVALMADGMTVEGGIFCTEEFQAEGEVRLLSAHIGGELDLSGAKLETPGGVALMADGVIVDNGMVCREGFQAQGEFRVFGAHIGGELDLSGAKLTNPGGAALMADGVTVDNGMFCTEKFQAQGEVRLLSAHIGGQLRLNGAELASPGGVALMADGMTVDGSMFCAEGFRGQGEVRLLGAHISEQLNLSGARLANPGGRALTGDGMTIGIDMFCREEFQAQGEVLLPGAHIGGQLDLHGASLSNAPGLALDCRNLEAESLLLNDTTITGTVDLTSAQVQVLHDDPGRWPSRMRLDYFTYQSLQPYAESRGKSGRLAWLDCAEPGYRAQPYEQLATYYRRLGHDEEARRVLLARQRRRRRTLGPMGKATGYLLDWIVGYGYRPGRAFAWLILFLVVGSVYFAHNRPSPLDPAQHPHYQPVLYTADQLIPLVNLSQANVWAPGATGQWVTFALVVLGWVLATAIVAGVTRVLARV